MLRGTTNTKSAFCYCANNLCSVICWHRSRPCHTRSLERSVGLRIESRPSCYYYREPEAILTSLATIRSRPTLDIRPLGYQDLSSYLAIRNYSSSLAPSNSLGHWRCNSHLGIDGNTGHCLSMPAAKCMGLCSWHMFRPSTCRRRTMFSNTNVRLRRLHLSATCVSSTSSPMLR